MPPAFLIHTISIHAPLAGSDVRGYCSVPAPIYFNPRSPRGERLTYWTTAGLSNSISIHAPLAGSDLMMDDIAAFKAISIHAPLAGSDLMMDDIAAFKAYFNPRSPRGERRKIRKIDRCWKINFNPRSPRGERRYDLATQACDTNFNPRSPRGERQQLFPKNMEKLH